MRRLVAILASVTLAGPALAGPVLAGPALAGPVLAGPALAGQALAAGPRAPAHWARAPFEQAPREIFVVRLDAVPTPAERARLAASGAEVLGVLPERAVLVRVDRAALSSLRALEGVRDATFLEPAARVAEALWPPFDRRRLAVLLARGTDPRPVRSLLSGAGAKPALDGDFDGRRLFVVTTSDRVLAGLVHRAEVLRVTPWGPAELHDAIARSSDAIPGARGGADGPLLDVERAWQRGIRGEGQVACVADTGLGSGSTATLPPDFGAAGDALNPLRLRAALAPGDLAPGESADWADRDQHGTHVAGTLLGGGVSSGARPGDDDFETSEAGLAPEAGLVVQKAFDGFDFAFFDHVADWSAGLYGPAHALGAGVHSSSWGSFGRGYDLMSLQVDAGAWDHPDLVIVQGAGNGGADGLFDNGGAGWSVDGCGSSDAWRRVEITIADAFTPGFFDCRSAGVIPVVAWLVAPWDCDLTHAPNLDACLTTPPLAVDPTNPPQELLLTHHLDTEGPADVGRVLLDRDDDGVFETLIFEGSGPAADTRAQVDAFPLDPAGWGTSARLRFHFTSDAAG